MVVGVYRWRALRDMGAEAEGRVHTAQVQEAEVLDHTPAVLVGGRHTFVAPHGVAVEIVARFFC